eukprot:639273-Prymnesium_polylepis.1
MSRRASTRTASRTTTTSRRSRCSRGRLLRRSALTLHRRRHPAPCTLALTFSLHPRPQPHP